MYLRQRTSRTGRLGTLASSSDTAGMTSTRYITLKKSCGRQTTPRSQPFASRRGNLEIHDVPNDCGAFPSTDPCTTLTSGAS